MIIIGLPIWILAFVLRFVLMVVGVFLVPFTLLADGARNTPRLYRWLGNSANVPASHNKNRWTKYVWMAWRNPLEGLDGTLTQPIPEERPNPDDIVRNIAVYGLLSRHRWMSHGIFWEYWYLRKVGGRYFEFRIGWKFVDGNADFVPTFQLGLRR